MPVYISYEAHDTGDAPAEEKKEWRRIYAEANKVLKRSGLVHVYVLAPADGKVIESVDVGTATQPAKLLARLEAVVSALGTKPGKALVPPAPQSRPPAHEAGALVLHLSARSAKGTWNEFPVENWVVLGKDQWSKLLPPRGTRVGESWELDKTVAATFLKDFLPNGYAYASNKKVAIVEQSLRGTIASRGDAVRARLEGTLKLRHTSRDHFPVVETIDVAEMKLVGYLDWGADRKQVRSLRLLADKASARKGQVEYSVGVRSVEAKKPAKKPAPKTTVLFDFEEEAEVRAWSNLEAPGKGPKGPAARIEQSAENATTGKHSLKITFAGGDWPTITTTRVPGDWMPYETFQADVTVSRPCLVGFTVLQEKSRRGGGWDATVSRWAKTAFLQPGKNVVSGPIHDPNNYSINAKMGKVVRFEIFAYKPAKGETIYVDNVRITTAKEARPAAKVEFKVLGTDLVVSGVRELGQKLRKEWKAPKAQGLAEVEAEFRARYAALKKAHPRAVLVVFRDGEKGYDPAHPERPYRGWRDAYWTSHGPDGDTVERARNTGKDSSHEIFMRHRSPLMRVDLSSIPIGSKVLAARLVIVRAHDKPVKEHNPGKPNIWVAEACNRPWVEEEVNAYEYARGKFWKAVGGMDWGKDPDFLPVYVAHGPSQGKVNTWDFTEAVRFWTDGRQANHGFMLHGDGGDWMPRAHSREAKRIEDRPAVWVVYEPRK